MAAGLFRCQLLLSLVVATMWSPGQCQGVQMLMHRLEEKMEVGKAYQVAWKEHPDIMDQMLAASEALGKLWTVHLENLLENNVSNTSVSPKCVESAESIIAASFLPNVTMPELFPLLDATGKPGPGLLSGNVIMNAAFDECFEYDYTGYCGGSVTVSFMPTITCMGGGLVRPQILHCSGHSHSHE